jgi:CHAT domain-containing protein/tetratricopeptide (TPR) repeat protein
MAINRGIIKRRRMITVCIILVSLCTGMSCMGDHTGGVKITKEDVLTTYEANGEPGLRQLIREKKSAVTRQFIDGFTAIALEERKEDWFGIAKIMAEEMKDEKALANVYIKMGDYLAWVLENNRPADYGKKPFQFFKNQSNSKTFYSQLGLYEKGLYRLKVIGDLSGQGDVKIKKGDRLLQLGHHLEALHNYQQALILYKKAGNARGEGTAFIKIGDLYTRYGYYSKAGQFFEQALECFKKFDAPLDMGAIHQKKGEISMAEGNKERAFEYFNEALRLYNKAIRSGIPENWRLCLERGKILAHVKSPSDALELYDKAWKYLEKEKDAGGRVLLSNSKADALFQLEKYTEAIELYKKVASYYEKNSMDCCEMRAFALYRQAKAQQKLGNTLEARWLFHNAISCMQRPGYQAPFVEMEEMRYLKMEKAYMDAVLFLFENEDYKEGFKAVEFSKTRFFRGRQVEILGNVDKHLSPIMKKKLAGLAERFSKLSKDRHNMENHHKDELENRYRELNSQLESLLIDIHMIYMEVRLSPESEKGIDNTVDAYSDLRTTLLKEKGKMKNEHKESIAKGSRRLKNMLEKQTAQVSRTFPVYRQRIRRPLTPRALEKNVLKNEESLVSYFVAGENIYALIIASQYYRELVKLEVSRAALKALVNDYLERLKLKKIPPIRRASMKLYQVLFKPVAEKLNRSRDIIILPEGEMVKIPFESLIVDWPEDGEPVYLLEKYRIKYVQSASLLNDLRRPFYSRGKINNNHFLGFGDPLYERKPGLTNAGTGKELPGSTSSNTDIVKTITGSRYRAAGGSMDRLLNSGEEVNAIARLFEAQGQKWEVNLRDQANEAKFKSSATSNYGYIHFAGHAVLSGPFQSLLLAQVEGERGNDGYFTLNEIMNCTFNASLVVLSACKSGSGEVRRGESISGLARAFMHAGTPAVVASLWKVKDKATRELMVYFYRNLLEKNMSKAEALRNAKLEMLKSREYSSPYFWSAFVMYGE